MPRASGDAVPQISVVIAVRDAATMIQGCLDSVFDQDAPAEIVVIDGASTDGTRAIVAANAERLAYWESAPDRGIYHAWNKALLHATGEWIYFLGADDRLASPDVLRRMDAALAGLAEGERVAYGRARIVDAAGAEVRIVGRPWSETREAFRSGVPLAHQAVFQRRELFERLGPFDERYRICGDYEWLLRELRTGDAVFVPDVVVADVGRTGLSSRPESERMMRREFHRARHANGLTRIPESLAPQVLRIELRDLVARTFGQGVAGAGVRAYRWFAGLLKKDR